MDIALISLNSWIGVLSLESPWEHLIGNIFSSCVFKFLTLSGVRRPVH